MGSLSSLQAARMLNKDESKLNLIVAHLGAGASITAIKDGKSVDTSMGLTPLEGCVAQQCLSFLRSSTAQRQSASQQAIYR